jgi:hypothetical protein
MNNYWYLVYPTTQLFAVDYVCNLDIGQIVSKVTMGSLTCPITPTPTATVTPTPSVTPTKTPSVTPTKTPTVTPTNTITPTVTPTVTSSPITWYAVTGIGYGDSSIQACGDPNNFTVYVDTPLFANATKLRYPGTATKTAGWWSNGTVWKETNSNGDITYAGNC